MLSASPAYPLAPLYASELAIGPALVSPPRQSTNQFPAVTTNEGDFSPVPAGLRTSGVVLVHVRLPTSATNAPMLFVFGSHATGGSHATNLAEGDQSVVSGEGDDPASSAQGGQVAPLMNFADASSPGDGAGISATTSFTTTPATAVAARTGAMGWVTFAAPNPAESTPSYGPPGGQNWPMTPDGKRIEVTGMLDADQTTMTFQIPVGQLSAALGLSLEETGGTGGVMPVFGQMELLNPNGTPIEQANPPPGAGPNMLQALTVLLHNATANSRLQVQIVAAETSPGVTGTSPGAESGTTVPVPSAGANFNVSFALAVQRQDVASPSQEASTSSLGALSIGTLIVAPSPRSGSSVAAAGWTVDTAETTTPVENQVASTTVSAAATETVEQAAVSFDSFNFRVLTGPLASRTASPLGPTLASIDAEATQEVDRRERAMSQEIDGLESLGGETSVTWRSENPDEGSSGSPASRSGLSAVPGTNDGPVIDAPGNGGYPMKVTSRARGQQTQISALWATLPSFADSETAAASSDQPEVPIHGLALESAVADRSSSSFSPVPNYVKAACGMVFGLMMTSGPLFPDLIARLPRRIPRSIIGPESRVRRTGSPAPRRFAPRSISAWLRGRLIAR